MEEAGVDGRAEEFRPAIFFFASIQVARNSLQQGIARRHPGASLKARRSESHA
jgi:hypothetical protein